MLLTVLHICPICAQTDLVEMAERLIRSSDEVLHENEYFTHLRRGRIDIIVHSRLSLAEEPKLVEAA